MQHFTLRPWCSPAFLVIVVLLVSCSSKTDLTSEASDSTSVTEDTVVVSEDTVAVGDDYASAEMEDAWANGPTGGGGPPIGGIYEYQTIWMSKAFDDEFNRTRNVDAAVEVDPLPIAYLDLTTGKAGESKLCLFDFTTFLANGGPTEQLVLDILNIEDEDNHVFGDIKKGDKNPRGITRMDILRKNDYDEDADGVMDDLHTLEMQLYRGDKLIEARSYFRTFQMPDEIAHTIQLTGTYKDAEGGVYTLGAGDESALPNRYMTCSNYLGTQECWRYTRFKLTTPEMTFDYVLQADEAGNDYLMMGEDAGFAYNRKGDSLTLYVQEGVHKLVKTK